MGRMILTIFVLLRVGFPSSFATNHPMNTNMSEQAILGGGCFWCTEAVFEGLEGVVDVESGYMGGSVPNPSYEQVCTGETGHAEVIRVTFDPAILSYSDLLDLFWEAHDPTTLNRQGADVGTQYRSIIYYKDENQKKAALESIRMAQSRFDNPIVTEVAPAATFYPAEDYHQNFYSENKNYPYCRAIITPKLKKLSGRK